MTTIDLSQHFQYDANSPTGLIRINSLHPKLNGKHTGLSTGNSYYKVSVRTGIRTKKYFQAHNVVWWLHNGEIPEGLEIDHINGVRTDNRIENLRLVTKLENSWNTTNNQGKTLPKGVSKNKNGFNARVRHNGKLHFSYFPTQLEAEDWVKAKRTELHGVYANHGE